MANDLSHNPLYIDTASASAITTDSIRVRLIRWTAATTAGHTAVVQDGHGRRKWASVAGGANYVEADHLDDTQPWDGLTVPTLGSGVLEIYLG